jgi:hypothetical protein
MPIPPEHDQIREFLYIHMRVSFWHTFYVMGMMPKISSGERASVTCDGQTWLS